MTCAVFQLDPVRIALKTPRVRILIGDDVGLGKTLEAGLIKAVKLAALEDGMNAWEIMEEAAEQWLARRKKSKRKA
jgi:hypothetical protein